MLKNIRLSAYRECSPNFYPYSKKYKDVINHFYQETSNHDKGSTHFNAQKCSAEVLNDFPRTHSKSQTGNNPLKYIS